MTDTIQFVIMLGGTLMIFLAYYVVSKFEGVVQANLTIVGIVDIPVFVADELAGRDRRVYSRGDRRRMALQILQRQPGPLGVSDRAYAVRPERDVGSTGEEPCDARQHVGRSRRHPAFLFGVLSGSVASRPASQFAVGGMLAFFAGGLTRAHSD